MPLAGVGILFGALGLSLIMGGAIGELVYATGDIDLSEYSGLLAIQRAYGFKVNIQESVETEPRQ